MSQFFSLTSLMQSDKYNINISVKFSDKITQISEADFGSVHVINNKLSKNIINDTNTHINKSIESPSYCTTCTWIIDNYNSFPFLGMKYILDDFYKSVKAICFT